MKDPRPWRIIQVAEDVERIERLDRFVARRVTSLSRRAVKEMIASGDITVNRRPTSKATTPTPGSTVEIWSAPIPSLWTPTADSTVPLRICYRDDFLIVVDKPSGIPSVPLGPGESGTLAGAVVHYFPECAELHRRPGDGGLLQRLDRETSGAVMAARSQAVFDSLVSLQQEGGVEKRYLAVVRPTATLPQKIESPLIPRGRGGRRMRTSSSGAPACTTIAVIEQNAEWALVEAVIHRGVRHQIRAHLASVGAPIAGDRLYGNEATNKGFERLFLHAHSVSFLHPISGKKVVATVSLPKELSKFVEKNLIISF